MKIGAGRHPTRTPNDPTWQGNIGDEWNVFDLAAHGRGGLTLLVASSITFFKRICSLLPKDSEDLSA